MQSHFFLNGIYESTLKIKTLFYSNKGRQQTFGFMLNITIQSLFDFFAL